MEACLRRPSPCSAPFPPPPSDTPKAGMRTYFSMATYCPIRSATRAITTYSSMYGSIITKWNGTETGKQQNEMKQKEMEQLPSFFFFFFLPRQGKKNFLFIFRREHRAHSVRAIYYFLLLVCRLRERHPHHVESLPIIVIQLVNKTLKINLNSF